MIIVLWLTLFFVIMLATFAFMGGYLRVEMGSSEEKEGKIIFDENTVSQLQKREEELKEKEYELEQKRLQTNNILNQINVESQSVSKYRQEISSDLEEITSYLENAKYANIDGEMIALMSPHAGYQYSGFTAANAYKQVKGKKYDAVIIIAPSHRELFHSASVFNGD